MAGAVVGGGAGGVGVGCGLGFGFGGDGLGGDGLGGDGFGGVGELLAPVERDVAGAGAAERAMLRDSPEGRRDTVLARARPPASGFEVRGELAGAAGRTNGSTDTIGTGAATTRKPRSGSKAARHR